MRAIHGPPDLSPLARILDDSVGGQRRKKILAKLDREFSFTTGKVAEIS